MALALICSCKQDPCKRINCGLNGYCVNGECSCNKRYEGEFCENKKDLCKDMQCLNGSNCDDGVCMCKPGYEGKYCESKMATKYLGFYLFSEKCVRSTDTTAANYDLLITEDPDIITIIYLNNLKTQGTKVKANLYGYTFEIPSQAFTSNLRISGNGKMVDSKLEVNYIIETNSPNPDRLFCSGKGI
jgi:hypothetical protein